MARWPLAAAGVAAFAWGRESSRDECPPTSFGCTGRTGQSNTFRRGFFGHVVPGGDGGSVISGTLRLHRAAAIFATEWVLGVAVFCLIIVGRLAVALVRSETAAIHGLLVAFGLLLLFVAAAVSMFELVFRKAQPDEAFLISWLQNKAKEIDSPPQSR